MPMLVTATRGHTDPGETLTFDTVEDFFDAVADEEHQLLPGADEPGFEQAKLSGQGVLAAQFDGRGKALANMVEDSKAWFIPIDMDDLLGTDTKAGRRALKKLLQQMSQYESVAWTTARHSPGATKMRWLVALEQPLDTTDPKSWKATYTRACHALGVGGLFDASCVDATRWSLLPQCQKRYEEESFLFRFEGKKLSITAVDAAVVVTQALGEARQYSEAQILRDQTRLARAQQQLPALRKKLSAAQPGNRNTTVFNSMLWYGKTFGAYVEVDYVLQETEKALRKISDGEEELAKFTSDAERAFNMGKQDSMADAETWKSQLDIGANGSFSATDRNLELILAHHEQLQGALAYNTRHQQAWVVGPLPWENDPKSAPRPLDEHVDAGGFLVWLGTEMGVVGTRRHDASKALYIASKADCFDPFIEWLDSLEWDGVERLGTWLQKHAGVRRTELNREMWKRWMVSAVARSRATEQEPVQAECVLVFEGEQGVGKTSFFTELAGHTYYGSASTNIGREAVIASFGRVMLELSEMSVVKQSKVGTLNTFIDRRADIIRLPYEKEAKTIARRYVMCGTTNDATYLHDSTGGRRFWPIEVGRIDIEQLKVDREQLWAEAQHLFVSGYPSFISVDEPLQEKVVAKQMLRMEEDPLSERVRATLYDQELMKYRLEDGTLHPEQFRDGRLRFITPAQLALIMHKGPVGHAASVTTADVRRLVAILQAMGLKRRRPAINGKQRVAYYLTLSSS